jgi:hypothetical protein
MSNCPLCNLQPPQNASAATRSIGLFRRAWRGIQWIFPTALLALMPKCPLCVAAYFALFTGIGISVTTARWIQISMFVVCGASLAYLAAKLGRKIRSRWRRAQNDGLATGPGAVNSAA